MAIARAMDTELKEDFEHIQEALYPLLINSLASNGQLEELKSMKKQGADFNKVDYNIKCPLTMAV